MIEALPFIAIAVSILGLILQYFAFIVNIQTRLSTVETKIDLFWKAIETNVIKMLKNYPTNINKDVLLDKLVNHELSLQEAQLLRTILIGDMNNIQDHHNQLAYVLGIARVEIEITELKKKNGNCL